MSPLSDEPPSKPKPFITEYINNRSKVMGWDYVHSYAPAYLLTAAKVYFEEFGEYPTRRVLADILGLSPGHKIRDRYKHLERLGYLRLKDGEIDEILRFPYVVPRPDSLMRKFGID